MKDNEEKCPHCNTDLQGEQIPKESQHLFGATHFSRKIGIYDMDKDRTTMYQCPDCDEQWSVYDYE